MDHSIAALTTLDIDIDTVNADFSQTFNSAEPHLNLLHYLNSYVDVLYIRKD